MSTIENTEAKLDKILLAVTNTVPFCERWVDCDGIGLILGFSKSYVQAKLVTLPDFPKPLRIGGNGHPRWSAQEVATWARQRRDDAPG
ncbi:hypothetical protein [Pseudomonas sp.]|jgi:predicted DNA-binding transcriptional regulator AlpA|uniref:helix-turn-helix transcriptional regulator n=1 Tax=Pseudomonas sp. TaxID=306 RepID=UPI002ED9348B